MSTFGSPGGQQSLSKPVAPQRGSFPLDHDGECTSQMKAYLTCLKRQKGVNQQECRVLSKNYLQCRMQNGLMAHDEMRNLGFADVMQQARGAAAAAGDEAGDARNAEKER